jgi:ribulose-5-phosphate 4-epimerase/fuculose-1-phosphate aldolase
MQRDRKSSLRRLATRSTARRGRQSVGCSIPSRKTPALSSKTNLSFDDTKVLVTEAIEGAHLAKALGPAKAAILRNHGLSVGETVDQAVWWFVSMERCVRRSFSQKRFAGCFRSTPTTPERLAR